MSCIILGKRVLACLAAYVTPLLSVSSIVAACYINATVAQEATASPETAASPAASLTLAQAAKKLLMQHPELQVYAWRLKAATGQAELAALNPAYTLAIASENLLGSGEYAGVKSQELTVALSSVLELGDKRQARLATASAERALLFAQQQASSLDLVGELTQRFISVLTLQQKQQLAVDSQTLAEQALLVVRQRVQSGAAPAAELLRAKVAVSQAQLQQGLLQAELESSKQALASLWGAQHPDFSEVSGDLLQLADSIDFQLLYQRLLATPQLEVFAATARLQQAQLAQLQSQSIADVSWQLGVKRAWENRDVALVAGIAVPLFSQSRQQAAIKIARSEQEAQRLNQQYELLQLRARLYQAWQMHRASSMAVRDLQREILPLLQQALTETEQAYLRGRYSYADWLSSRQALQEAQLQLLDAASTALSNQALIEQLSGQPLAAHHAINHKLSSSFSSAGTAGAGVLP